MPLPGATLDPADPTLLHVRGRRVRLVHPHGRDWWSFGEEVFDADAVAFLEDGATRMLIARDELHDLLPGLHCAADGWALELRDGRLLDAEYQLRTPAAWWAPEKLLSTWA